MINVGCRPVHLFYDPLVNSPLNNPSDFRILPHLSVALWNRLTLLALSFRGPLESKQAATAVYHIRRNVPISRNGSILTSCNLPFLSVNIYYYLLLLPNRPLIYLQYVVLL